MDRIKVGMERRLKTLKIIEKYVKGKKVLDVGFNAGTVTKYFSEKGFEVTGIDLQKKWVDFAKSNYPQGNFLLGDVMKEKGKYDTVMIIGVLGEIPISPIKVLKKVKENLNGGGRIIVAVRNMISLKRRVKTLLGMKPVDAPDSRLWYFTRKRLVEVIEDAGYDLLKMTTNKWESWGTKTIPTPDFISEEIYAVIEPKKD